VELKRLIAANVLALAIAVVFLLPLGMKLYSPVEGFDLTGPVRILGDLSVTGNISSTRAMTADSMTAVSQFAARDCIIGWTFATVKDSLATRGRFSLGVKAFASLGTPDNGSVYYCPDCTAASNPATGGGSGAVVIRQNGAWKAL